MKYRVIILPEAKGDLVDIYSYIAENDFISRADRLLDNIEDRCRSLHTMPQRGHEVPELKHIHVEGFCEIHFKPYRIIYQVIGKEVFIHAILDGRRELQELLERRLLR